MNLAKEEEFFGNLQNSKDCYQKAFEVSSNYLGSSHKLTLRFAQQKNDFLQREKKQSSFRPPPSSPSLPFHPSPTLPSSSNHRPFSSFHHPSSLPPSSYIPPPLSSLQSALPTSSHFPPPSLKATRGRKRRVRKVKKEEEREYELLMKFEPYISAYNLNYNNFLFRSSQITFKEFQKKEGRIMNEKRAGKREEGGWKQGRSRENEEDRQDEEGGKGQDSRMEMEDLEKKGILTWNSDEEHPPVGKRNFLKNLKGGEGEGNEEEEKDEEEEEREEEKGLEEGRGRSYLSIRPLVYDEGDSDQFYPILSDESDESLYPLTCAEEVLKTELSEMKGILTIPSESEKVGGGKKKYGGIKGFGRGKRGRGGEGRDGEKGGRGGRGGGRRGRGGGSYKEGGERKKNENRDMTNEKGWITGGGGRMGEENKIEERKAINWISSFKLLNNVGKFGLKNNEGKEEDEGDKVRGGKQFKTEGDAENGRGREGKGGGGRGGEQKEGIEGEGKLKGAKMSMDSVIDIFKVVKNVLEKAKGISIEETFRQEILKKKVFEVARMTRRIQSFYRHRLFKKKLDNLRKRTFQAKKVVFGKKNGIYFRVAWTQTVEQKQTLFLMNSVVWMSTGHKCAAQKVNGDLAKFLIEQNLDSPWVNPPPPSFFFLYPFPISFPSF